MAASMSKEEYLKRYLSGNESIDNVKKKRKKKKTTIVSPKSKIVDDDVDFDSLLPENINNTLEEDVGDNEPTVAEFIDERPEHIKRIENYRNNDRWKILAKSGKQDFGVVNDSYSETDRSPTQTRPRYDSDSDQSPPRKRISDSDQSPPRKKRQVSDSDQSPPRKKRQNSDSDQSPPRNKRQDSDSDQSPPRKKRQDSDSDQSPPRKKRQDSNSNKSPQRTRKDTDFVIVKSSKRSGNSPKQKKNRFESDSNVLQSKSGSENRKTKPTKTLSGAKAGLSSAKEMHIEAEKKRKREDAAFQKIGATNLGKDAKTVFRDKSGKRRNLKEEQDKQNEEDEKKAKEEEKYRKWGQGLKQREEQEKSVMAAIHEANKPMARYKDDDDLDDHLRKMERAEDPMLAFITKKKQKQNNKPEKPRYKGPLPPPNRFNIMPGYRWDGVNRSIGFEAQIFAKMSEQKAVKSMAYKWSVEEM